MRGALDRLPSMFVEPPSEAVRVRVWEEMIAANMRSMYFARLAARERRAQKGAAVLTAAFSAVACAVILSGAEVGLWLLWPMVPAALLSGASGLGRYGESAARFVNCSLAWADLHHRLRDTWVDIETGRIDRERVLDAVARVGEHARHIDRDVVDKPERVRLLDRCHDQAIALASGASG